MDRLYLRDIVEDFTFEKLPVRWQNFDLAKFSKDKKLFDFQQFALKNALRALWRYFEEKQRNKSEFYKIYVENGLTDELKKLLDYDLRRSRALRYLLEYPDDYPVVEGKISFEHFINRMSFWMATGSGKTLVIVKLIEILGKLINQGELPEGDILFLAPRDDLLEQFIKHVEEFNSFNLDAKIRLESLKDYESVKRERILPFTKNEILAFYYRSDLISDEQAEKKVHFRNYAHGNWYIILDEAHKGDKEESKRQALYSILSRKRFLFNFSATFTDPRDYVVCVYNFNLANFVKDGYGKHIYVSKKDISAFRRENDFSPEEKQRVVLKALLLLTYIQKCFEEVRSFGLYHRPLLLTLVNSVNKEDSDLELFFRELEKVAKNEIREDVLKKARDDLLQEFIEHSKFEFENKKFVVDSELLSDLDYKDILKYVFNADTPSSIEVLTIPNNKNELIFKLKTSSRPFALIKIGDISGWLKEKLAGYEINESFENESYFSRINADDSDINILMGSRAFYEGWDSNRPNIILFINIGEQDAKKFVLQSIGRGVRIEPIRNKRRRLLNLLNDREIDENLFNKVKNFIPPIETLFIFGTKARNLEETLGVLREQEKEKNLGDLFVVNPEVQNRVLLIPVYKDSEKMFAEEYNIQKLKISPADYHLAKQFFEYIGDKVALVKYDCEIAVLEKVKTSFSKPGDYYDKIETHPSLFDAEIILGRIFRHFSVRNKEIDRFKRLEDEIVHFKKISFRGDDNKYNELREKIEMMREFPKTQREKDEIYEKLYKREITREEFERLMHKLLNIDVFELNGKRLKIKYLANHYYHPLLVSEQEKIDFINYIIRVPSEKNFLEELEKNINEFSQLQLEWWMFSKIDENLDEVYIPYYDPDTNRMRKFKPDFIFWFKKGNYYLILFVDPKGTEHVEAYRKIDGYSRIFEVEKGGQKVSKDFYYDDLIINTKLIFWTRKIANVEEKYLDYWCDNFEKFFRKIQQRFEGNQTEVKMIG